MALISAASFLSFMTPVVWAEDACPDNRDLPNGIVFEFAAPKGTIFNVVRDVGDDYVLTSTYNTVKPNRTKLITKSYKGLFGSHSWKENAPVSSRHVFSPSPASLIINEVGQATKYQENWTVSGFGKFSAKRTMRMQRQVEVNLGDCRYIVRELIVSSSILLANGKKKNDLKTKLYIPELDFAWTFLTIEDLRNVSVRKRRAGDFFPEDKNQP